ncbi:MAG: 23S rRNA (guanosine(2251)-2'-O)-methyltransferase RlmB [Candidatus Hydrogenedentota bacterium]
MTVPSHAAKAQEKIFGRRAVLEALLAGRRSIQKIILARGLKGHTFREIIDEAEKLGIPIQECERKRLDVMAGTEHHQGILAMAAAIADEGVAAILARAQLAREDPFILLADGVTDPQNLGALIRSAEAAGVHGVIVPDKRIAPVDRATAKASAGAVEHVPVCHVGNMGQTILRLKSEGMKIFAADADPGAISLYEADFSGGVSIVIGSEGRGLSPVLKDRCDARIRIPMKGKLKSLNASAAAAVILFEVVRRRMGRSSPPVRHGSAGPMGVSGSHHRPSGFPL